MRRLANPTGFSLMLFAICGPINWLFLLFWAGFDFHLWFKALSFQPQVFVWLPLCAPFVPLLCGDALKSVLAELAGNRRHLIAFVALNCVSLLTMFLIDFSSPNVMPYEIRMTELGHDAVDTFRSFKNVTTGTAVARDSLSDFGNHMAAFVWKPSTWSFYRAMYYAVLLIGWSVMLLQITSSIFAVYVCSTSEGTRREQMEKICVQFLGAAIPALPFLVLRRINHLNKVSLYHVDKLNVFDWYLAILIIVVVIGLLICVHTSAKNIQTAFSVVSSLGSAGLFAKPEVAAAIMFSGDAFQTVIAIIGIPFVLALFLWPWLLDSVAYPIDQPPNKAVNPSGGSGGF